MPHGDDDKVLHTMCRTIYTFTNRCHVSIVTDSDSQSQTVTYQGCQRHNPPPGKICCILNTARQEIATRSTDTYRTYGFVAAIGLDQCQYFLAEYSNVLADNGIV